MSTDKPSLILTTSQDILLAKPRVGRPLRDRIGERFDRLVVIAMERKDNRTYAICMCDCGKIKSIGMTNLVKGTTGSCRCKGKRKDLTGLRFASLVVTKMFWGVGADAKTYCDVACDCGNTARVLSSNLLRKITQSCGCGRFRTFEQKKMTRVLANMKRRARMAELPYNFTAAHVDFMFQYWDFACAICHRPDGSFFYHLAYDHWIPVNSHECPGTVIFNMVPLCHKKSKQHTGERGCNNEKRTLMPEIWLTSKLGHRRAKKKLDEVEAYFRAAHVFVTAQKGEQVCAAS